MTDYQLMAAKMLQRALRKSSGYAPPKRVSVPPQKRLAAFARPKSDLWPIANAIMTEVGNCVPDGDPIDRLAPLLQRMGIDRWDVTKWLDKAAREYLRCKSYNDYLVQQWDGWNECCDPDQRIENPWR